MSVPENTCPLGTFPGLTFPGKYPEPYRVKVFGILTPNNLFPLGTHPGIRAIGGESHPPLARERNGGGRGGADPARIASTVNVNETNRIRLVRDNDWSEIDP